MYGWGGGRCSSFPDLSCPFDGSHKHALNSSITLLWIIVVIFFQQGWDPTGANIALFVERNMFSLIFLNPTACVLSPAPTLC